jgi:NAD-dependent dihydropyrimidine dehydrogenase PreA subunit
VLVWDQHGQWVAESGARLAASVPFLRDTVIRTFGGAEPLTGSFFFMNLFLHVAIPLVMVLGIWVHTAHLAKPGWLPHTATFVPLLIALLVVSVFWPAPLLREADPLRLTGRMPSDLFAGFWMPFADAAGGGVVAGSVVVLSLLLLLVPWWWQGRRAGGPAVVDPVNCIGCAKCSKDCPFEAITMSGRSDGSRLLLSVVNADRCVQCGLCVASCNDNAISLPGQTLAAQILEIDNVMASYLLEGASAPVLVFCRSNPGIERSLVRLRRTFPGLVHHGVSCAGVFHASAMAHLLTLAPRVLLVTCPGENCANRWGYELASARMANSRKPGLELPEDRARIRVVALSGHEHRAMAAALGESSPTASASRWRPWFRTAVAHVVLVLLMAAGSACRLGEDPASGAFRTFLSLPGFSVKQQVEWTEKELAEIPAHMRLPRNVTRRPVHYEVEMLLDGRSHHRHALRARRDGQEVRFVHEVRLPPGQHQITLRLLSDADGQVHTLYDKSVSLDAGQVEVFAFDGKSMEFGERMQMRKQ